MVICKSPKELEKMYQAGQIVWGALEKMRTIVRPGISTKELDEFAVVTMVSVATPGVFPLTLTVLVALKLTAGGLMAPLGLVVTAAVNVTDRATTRARWPIASGRCNRKRPAQFPPTRFAHSAI